VSEQHIPRKGETRERGLAKEHKVEEEIGEENKQRNGTYGKRLEHNLADI